MYENDIYFVREEVLKRIYKEYSFLHIGELQIIFEEGSAEKFGQVYSLTPLAINRWIVAYLDSDCRKRQYKRFIGYQQNDNCQPKRP